MSLFETGNMWLLYTSRAVHCAQRKVEQPVPVVASSPFVCWVNFQPPTNQLTVQAVASPSPAIGEAPFAYKVHCISNKFVASEHCLGSLTAADRETHVALSGGTYLGRQQKMARQF